MTEEERKRLLSQINIISLDDTSNEANQIRARVNQQDQNFFADVGRVFEATGAGISSTLSNLGKGALLAGRDLGGASDFADKITNEMRKKSDVELEDIAKKNNISTTTLKDYINKSKTSYENINDFSANTFDKWANEANQRVQELQAETDNPFTKEVIGFMPNLSQQAVNVGVSFINPALVPYVAGLEAKGSYYNDAKQRGMTDEQANDFSTAMAGVEAFTEKLTVKDVKAGITKIGEVKSLLKGGIKGATKEATQEAIKETVKETTKSGIKEAFKSLAKGMGENAFQEGVTEIIQEAFADAITKKDLGQSFYDFLNQQDNWEDIWGRVFKSAVGGALSAGITGGVGMGVSSCVSVNNKIQNGEQVTQQEILQANQDAIEKSKTLPKEQQEQFNEQITQGSEIGIQNVINQVETEQNQPQNEQKSAVPMQTSENAQQQVQEQEQQVIPNQNENALKENVEPQNLVESAERSGIDVKDEKTRKNLEVIQKFNENRGVKATFDADAFKGHDNVNSFFRVDENGNREIVFNPNTKTNKTIQQLAVHEVYHDMVAGGTAQELTDFVVQKMSNNPEYQEYVRALQDVYEEQDSDIIKEEAVAHYLEKNLGTNEFISELQERGDRTTIQKIIDTIKDMITKAKNTLTGKGDLNYLLDLQRKYEQAYRGEFKGTQEQTKLSKQVDGNETEPIKVQYKGEEREYKNYYDFMKDISENEEKLANNLLFKHNSYDFEIPTSKNETSFYHGTDYSGYYKDLNLQDYSYGMDRNYGDYFYVTSDKTQTTPYGRQIAQFIIPNDKILSLEEYRKMGNVSDEELFNKYLAIEMPDNEYIIKDIDKVKEYTLDKAKEYIKNKDQQTQPTTDNQGRTLTKEQQDYFKDSKVRDENGKILPVYHSTSSEFNVYDKNKMGQNYGWLEFGDGFYFTPSLETAKDFGEIGLRTGKTNIKEQYLDIENPFNIYKSNDKETINKMALDIENEYNQKNNSNLKISDFKKENGGRFIDFLKNGLNYSDKEIQNILKKYGYDGINAIENKNGEYKGQVVAFEPNQIKNIDNTNPTENADIRFSKSEDAKGNVTDNLDAKNLSPQEIVDNIDKSDGTLLAIHNLSEEKLNGILELGGFPVPSIAITDPSKVGHNQFGNISVVFDKSTIDPSNSLNEVFDRDVWSPTFPKVDYEINENSLKDIANKLGIETWRLKDYAEDSSKPEYLVDSLSRNEEVIDKYIKDNNLDYETSYEEEDSFKRSYNNTPEMQQFVKENNITVDKLANDNNLREQYFQIAGIEKDKGELYDRLNVSFDYYKDTGIDNFLISTLNNDIQILKGERKTQPKIDTWQTNRNKEKVAEKNGLKEYLEEQVKSVYGDKGIYNGKEYITENGRRSFWELHDEYNLENIVDALTSKDTKGTQDWFAGYGQIQAKMAKQFNSIQDIKANENLITSLSEENNILTEARDNIEADIDNLVENNDIDIGIASELLADFASDDLTIDNFKRLTKDYYQATRNVSDTQIKKIIKDLKALKNLPTDYFEAKPQRAVGLDEVATIVIPEGRTELKQALQDRGLDVIEYNPDIEGDRQAKLNELSEYKFSQQGQGTSQQIIDNFLENTKVNEGTGTAIKDLARVPIQQETQVETKTKEAPVPQETTQNNTKNNEILKTARQLLDKQYALQLSDEMANLSETELKSGLQDLYKSQLDEQLYNAIKDDTKSKRTYMKYKDKDTNYVKSVVEDALYSEKPNRNGKLTVKQWLNIANEIGINASDLTTQQIQDLAYGSWFDLKPTKRITQYDNKIHQAVPFEALTADKWVNAIYNKAKDLKIQDFNQLLDEVQEPVKSNISEITEPVRQVAPSEAPAQVPQVNEVKQRQVEPIKDITDVERPQVPQNQKTRKTYESIINSNQMTQEAKQIAKELMGYDTYVPQTNKFTLEQADRNIKQNGVDESLTTLTNKINNNNKVDAIDIATGERLIEYYSKIGDRQKLQEAIQSTAMAGTEAGRAVQAMSMINHQTPIGQVTWIQRSVDKVNKRLAKEGKKAQFNFTPEMQQKILNSTSENLQQNLNEVYKELGKQVPKSNMEKFNEWRYFSMLANPKTHFRNILGNLVMAQVQRAKNKVAGTIEDFVIGDNAERWNSLKGASKGMYEFAKNDLKNADVQSMLGLNENKYNPQSRLQQNQRTFKSDLLENTLGKLFNLNSKALEVEDGWGLKSGYAKAMANYLNANNLDYNNLTDAQLQKARQYAVEQAKEATFHQDNSIANMLQTIENKNLFTKIALGGAIPFKKTPMNVALTGFEYSPAGFAKTLTTDLVNLRKGKISANQFIDNISKNLTGTAISLLGYGLTQAGILKASGSGDEDKDEFEEATGKQNYSIQIGDKTYSLDWLTPAGIPLFIGSELYQVSHQKEDGNKTKNENEAFKSVTKILDATASAMNPMSEMTMISGLTNALKSYAQGSTKSIENMLANVGKSYATQAVPTALGQIARSTDQYERSTTSTETDPMAKAIDSAKNQIISKIPGLRETLPVSTDVWGNARETQSYEENAILPWTSKEISKDPVNKALTELYDATGESGVLPDNYIDKSLTIDKEKYKLTNEEYARLKQQYGKTAHDILADLTKSKEYEQMSDEQRVKAVKEAYSYAKSTLKVTYSDENNLDAEESSTYKKVQSVIDNGGDAKEYFEYTGLIDGVKKEKEKRQILLNSNLKDKGAIYESTIGSDDETYQIMKATGIDPDAYLDYKQQDFSSDKEDDGTIKGKTVSGSGKTKFYDYMDNADMTYEQKLLLTGMKYKLLPGERDTLANYIDTLPISASEKTDIYKKLKGATVYQNGEIYY